MDGTQEFLDWNELFNGVVVDWFTMQQQQWTNALDEALISDDWSPMLDSEDDESYTSSCRYVFSGVLDSLPILFGLRFVRALSPSLRIPPLS